MAQPSSSGEHRTSEAVAAYKRLLSEIMERRPSGTRQRLALALAKNRSFVSQITNPAYSTPIPASHLPTIFELCHFSVLERHEFNRLYAKAHPRKVLTESARPLSPSVHLPDLGDEERNRKLHGLVTAFVRDLAKLINEQGKKGNPR